MQITRQYHQKYLGMVTPILITLYLIQIFLYHRFAPAHLAGDMNVFLGIGLAMIIFCYHFYDYHHQISFHRNYLEVRFDILKMKQEILYQKIERVEVSKTRKHFGDIKLYLQDGLCVQLHHVDRPQEVLNYLESRLKKSLN